MTGKARFRHLPCISQPAHRRRHGSRRPAPERSEGRGCWCSMADGLGTSSQRRCGGGRGYGGRPARRGRVSHRAPGAMATTVGRLVSHPGRIRAVPCGHHRRRLAESWQVGNGTRQQAASGGGRTFERTPWISLSRPTIPRTHGARERCSDGLRWTGSRPSRRAQSGHHRLCGLRVAECPWVRRPHKPSCCYLIVFTMGVEPSGRRTRFPELPTLLRVS